MILPETLAVDVEYVDSGELIQVRVNFISTYRAYLSDGQSMIARLYTTDDLSGAVVRDICIVVNALTKQELGDKALGLLVKAITQCDIYRHTHPGSSLGISFPLKREIVDGFEDGSVRPLGLAGCLRYVSASRFNTTTVSVLPFNFSPES